MSLFAVVQRILNKAGNAFIEPRREDGHGSSEGNPSFIEIVDDSGNVATWLNEIPQQNVSGLPVRAVGGTGRASVNNVSTTPLNAGQTYTGTAELDNFSDVLCTVYTDKDATLYIEFSPDGTNWDSSSTLYVNGGLQERHCFVKGPRYFRVRLTNTSASNQTVLRLHCYFGTFRQLALTLNSQIREDADSITVRSIDSETDIAAGRYQGFSIVNKFGSNLDVDTATLPEDVWNVGGAYSGFPNTTLETITILSSSTADTSNGTGAQQVRITGLDANYNVISETVTMNGTTGAATTAQFRRAHTMQVVSAGSGGVNSGTITARHTTTTANVFVSIVIGRNQSNCSAYTVPAGFTAFMRKITGSIRGTAQNNADQVVDAFIWTRSFGAPFRLRRPFSISSKYRLQDDIYGGLVFTEKSDIIIRVTAASGNDIEVVAGYDLLLVKNLE